MRDNRALALMILGIWFTILAGGMWSLAAAFKQRNERLFTNTSIVFAIILSVASFVDIFVGFAGLAG